MPSRATMSTLGVLAMCEGCMLGLKAHYAPREKNKTVLKMCSDVHDACKAAHKLWDIELDARDLKDLAARLAAVERAACDGQARDVVVMTSLCLALLDDILLHIREIRRRAAIERVSVCMARVHRYFDRRDDRWSDYETASRAAEAWTT